MFITVPAAPINSSPGAFGFPVYKECMMNKIYLVWLLAIFTACSKDAVYIPLDEEIQVSIPENFPEIQYDLSANSPTKRGFELGKKLFYDGKLSANGVISCGFCHEQRFAFTHHGHQFSHGIEDREGIRNAPAIQNMAFLKEFAWDGATAHLDLFPIIPITNEAEMGETMTNVLEKLRADSEYPKLFSEAFEEGAITHENFLKALSKFMLMMVSANSRYDQFIRGENGESFSQTELKGMQLFQQKCSSCHQTDLFTDQAFRNNGLPVNPKINDLGRAEVSGKAADNYKFKVPSLRNVGVTAPYMHDGRFGSLEAVLDFYDHGVVDSPTLDEKLRQNGQLGIPMKETEKRPLLLFSKH